MPLGNIASGQGILEGILSFDPKSVAAGLSRIGAGTIEGALPLLQNLGLINTPQGVQFLEDLQRELAEGGKYKPPETDLPKVGQYVKGGLESAAQMAPALLGGVALGSAALPISYAALAGFGEAMSDERMKDRPFGERVRFALKSAAAEGIPEAIPAGHLIKALKEVPDGLKVIQGYMGREIAQEEATELLNVLNEVSEDLDPGNIGQRMVDVAGQTMVASGALAGAGAATRKAGEVLAPPSPPSGVVAPPFQLEAAGVGPVSFDLEPDVDTGPMLASEPVSIGSQSFPTRGGKITGAPKTLPDAATIDAQIDKMVEQLGSDVAQNNLEWYERSGDFIREMSHGDQDLMERTTRLMAVFSPRAQVLGNTTVALKAAYEIASGKPIDEIVTRSFAVNERTVREALKAREFTNMIKGVGPKVMNFYRNLHDATFQRNDYPDAATIDMWAGRNAGFPLNKNGDFSPSENQYEVARKMMVEVASRYNAIHGTDIKARHAHAGLWAYEKDVTEGGGGRQGFFSYREAGELYEDVVTYETVPHPDTGVLPELQSAPIEVKAAYTKGLHDIIVDQNGADRIADIIGLPLYRSSEGFGGFEGEVNPNLITGAPGLPVGDNIQTNDDLVDLYAKALGYVYDQKAVPWHRADNVGPSEGLVVKLSRDASPEELATLQTELNQRSGVDFTVLRGEMRMIDFFDFEHNKLSVPLVKFQTGVEDFINNHPDLFDLESARFFKANSNYLEQRLANEQDQKGKSFEDQIRDAGRSDLLNELRILKTEVRDYQKGFAKEQGFAKEGLVPEGEFGMNLPLEALGKKVTGFTRGIVEKIRPESYKKDVVSPDIVLGGRPMTDEQELLTPQEVFAEDTFGDMEPIGFNPKTFAGPEEVMSAMKNLAITNAKNIDAAKRGIRSWKTTDTAARMMMLEPEQMDQIIRLNKGRAYNAEEIHAVGQMLVGQAAVVTQVAKRAAETQSDADLISLEMEIRRHNMMQETFAGARGEVGRALNILKKVKQETLDAQRGMSELIESLGGSEKMTKVAYAMSQLKSPEQVSAAVKSRSRGDKWDTFMAIWMNMLLSGPHTHAVNITSNAAMALWTIPEHAMASLLGKLHGGSKVYMREIPAMTMGTIRGAIEGVAMSTHTLLTGEVSDVGTKIDYKHGGLGDYLPATRLLKVEDEFFKSVAYRQIMNAMSIRMAKDAVKKGEISKDQIGERIKSLRADPPLEMLQKVTEFTRRQTLQAEPGDFIRWLSSSRKFGMARYPVDIIVPFKRIISNIWRESMTRSPVAPLMRDFWKDVKKGGADRDLALAKWGLGTMISGVFYALVKEGFATGSGPDDPEKRRIWLTEHQPHSINLKLFGGPDKWLSIGRLEPLATPLMMIAELAEMENQALHRETADAWSIITHTVASMVGRQTFLIGFQNAAKAIAMPEIYGGSYWRKLLATAVPTISAHYARSEDQYWRDTRVTGEDLSGPEKIWEQLKAEFKNRTVGKKELPLMRDYLGRPIASPTSFYHPFSSKPVWRDPLAGELLNLDVNVPRPPRRFAPGLTIREAREMGVPRKIASIELTPKQYEEFQIYVGKMRERRLRTLFDNPQFRRLPGEKRRELYRKAVRDGLREGKKIFYKENAWILRKGAKKYVDEMVERAIRYR